MNFFSLISQGDALSKIVAFLLLTMSVISWVIIIYKSLLLRVANRSIQNVKQLFWSANTQELALQQAQQVDTSQWMTPLLNAKNQIQSSAWNASQMAQPAQFTRVLRDELRDLKARMQWGQVTLATIGATSPFVGLLGTVWGIFHALTAIGQSSQFTLARVATPVGEALIMTAAGLAVAIPAVVAYNLLGRRIANLEAELEGFAQDLLHLWQNSALTHP
ncbi:MAG: MotA/TolQ/ExbB proton channel family protein [Limnohabitans sp.]|nr:MotA/TolQ/ExbB proton channel family protein [Limnohabitans sp.]